MTNILLIVSKLAEERTGGVQTRIINYAKNFSKFNINPVILSISDYTDQQADKLNNILIYKYPKHKPKLNYLFFLRSIIKEYKITGIHILEIPTGMHQQLSLLIGKLHGIKTGVSFYGGEIWDARESKDKKQNFRLGFAMKLASKIAVNSLATKNFIPNKFKYKIHIVYPGANSELLKYRFKNKPNNAFKLLYIGRLIRRKGLDDIIKAVNFVKKNNPIKLTIVGKGKNERISEYKKLIKDLNLENQIEFAGEINDIKNIAYYYSNCDVLIMAPKLVQPVGGFESFGCVYLEAGLFKKPAIGTKHFGVKEAIIDGKTGLLVNENNPKEISDAIAKLINNKALRKKLGENNYHRTIKYFMDLNSTQQLSGLFL